MEGVDWVSTDGKASYKPKQPGNMTAADIQHVSGLLGSLTANTKLETGLVNKVPSYYVIVDLNRKPITVHSYRAGQPLLPRPQTNDELDLVIYNEQVSDLQKYKEVRPGPGVSLFSDGRGGPVMYREYRAVVYPPKGIQWTDRQRREAMIIKGGVKTRAGQRYSALSGQPVGPKPTAFNTYTQDTGAPQVRKLLPQGSIAPQGATSRRPPARVLSQPQPQAPDMTGVVGPAGPDMTGVVGPMQGVVARPLITRQQEEAQIQQVSRTTIDRLSDGAGGTIGYKYNGKHFPARAYQ